MRILKHKINENKREINAGQLTWAKTIGFGLPGRWETRGKNYTRIQVR